MPHPYSWMGFRVAKEKGAGMIKIDKRVKFKRVIDELVDYQKFLGARRPNQLAFSIMVDPFVDKSDSSADLKKAAVYAIILKIMNYQRKLNTEEIVTIDMENVKKRTLDLIMTIVGE